MSGIRGFLYGGAGIIEGMEQSTKKVALVTGGSRGIGRAIVENLARRGYDVVLTWNSNRAAADEAVTDLSSRGYQVRAVRANLSASDSVEETVKELAQEGPFNVVVNNASAGTEIGPIFDTELDEWNKAITINATAPFLLIKYLAPLMPEGSSIINISSLNTLSPQPGIAEYCAGKSALEALTQVAAKELAAKGITVNAIRPGVTDTDGQREVNPDPELRQQLAQMTPMGRLGRPEDIAKVAAFLAGPESRWVTGQMITASGGL